MSFKHSDIVNRYLHTIKQIKYICLIVESKDTYINNNTISHLKYHCYLLIK